jgi:hypothetical protein
MKTYKKLSNLLKKEKINVHITPSKAKKIASNAIIKPTTFWDCLDDIQLRAERGYTWTVMLSIDTDTLQELTINGWKTKTMNTNHVNGTYMVRIEW